MAAAAATCTLAAIPEMTLLPRENRYVVFDSSSDQFTFVKDKPDPYISDCTWAKLKALIEEKLNPKLIEHFRKDVKDLVASHILTKKTFNLLKPWLVNETEEQNYIQPTDGIWTPGNLTADAIEQLIVEAQKVKIHAYSGFVFHSHMRGAAVLTKNGNVFYGSQIETGKLGIERICAENIAINAAITHTNTGNAIVKQKEIVAIAVITITKPVVCVPCRSFLYSVNKDMKIIIAKTDGTYKIHTANEYGWER